jgi:hypothetical protein
MPVEISAHRRLAAYHDAVYREAVRLRAANVPNANAFAMREPDLVIENVSEFVTRGISETIRTMKATR